MESCSRFRITNGNGRFSLGEDEMQRIWKNYFTVNICCFHGIQRDNYFGGKPIRKNEVEARMRKLRMERL